MEHVIVHGDEEAEVVVKATGLREKGGLETQVPFSLQAGGVACLLEVVGQGALVGRQSELVLIAHARVMLKTETGLVAAGDKPSP